MVRRIVLLAWMLLFMMLGAAAESTTGQKVYVVKSAGVTALVNEAGESILEDESIDEIFTVRPDCLYAVGTRGDYALYDAAGNPRGAVRFAMIGDAGDALIFRQGDLYGVMSASGDVLLPAEWSQMVSNGEGGFLGLSDGTAYHIDNQMTATPLEVSIADGLTAFHDGRMVFIDENGGYGCLDPAGKVAIAPDLDWIDAFRDGIAIAAVGGGYGVIDSSGTWIVDPQYRWMRRGESFVAGLDGEGNLRAFSNQGDLLFEVFAHTTQAAIVGDYVAIWDTGTARLYNAKGRCIYEAPADTLFFPGADGQVIASAGQWDAPSQWLVDPSGIAGEGRYQRVMPLQSGRYAFLTMQGVEYYSELLDSLQISWNYDSARWGLMDGNGVALLPAEYLEIRLLGTDRLLLRGESTVIFADTDGKPLRVWRLTPTRNNSEAAAQTPASN